MPCGCSGLVPVVKNLLNVAVGSEVTVWQPDSGKRFVLMGMYLSGGAVGTYEFRDGVGGPVIFALSGGLVIHSIDLSGIGGIPSEAADNGLTCDGPSTTISGSIWGYEV